MHFLDDMLENNRFSRLFPNLPQNYFLDDFYINGQRILGILAFANAGLWYSYFLDMVASFGDEHMRLYIDMNFDLVKYLKVLRERGLLKP